MTDPHNPCTPALDQRDYSPEEFEQLVTISAMMGSIQRLEDEAKRIRAKLEAIEQRMADAAKARKIELSI